MRVAVALLGCLLSIAATRAWARPVRRLFEPTDLELEDPGVAEVDLQMGVIRGRHPYRLAVPALQLEGGVDLEQGLDAAGVWSVEGELGGVRFLSADADQLTGTAGFAFHPNDRLEISLIGLAGLTAGSDRYGVLLGISRKVRLWH